ncbi:MAG: glycosyltransferase [Syntrophomonadaceae bacterium]
MKKKKALVYLDHFIIGGAEKSNLHLMKRLIADGWEVELVLKTSRGTMENQIPEAIKVSYLDGGILEKKKGDSKFIIRPKDFLRRLVQKINMNRYKNQIYDLAINGLQADAGLIGRYIKADVKLQWIRIDLNAIKRRGKALDNLKKYADYIDGYCCVSQPALESLLANAPFVKDRAFLIYNFFDQEEISEKIKDDRNPFAIYDPTRLRVVTVCRIQDRQKGVFRMLNVYKRLYDDGIKFFWFVIGGGEDLEELTARVYDLGLNEGFRVLGPKDNPFPYYRHADLCATLSFYEGFARTVTEGKLMGKAVIATEFAGAREQIQHLSNGYIVDNDEDSIYEGMKTLLTDRVLLESITNDFLPDAILDENLKAEKLYKIIDDIRARKHERLA